ncbi:MAG: hypothetical protein KatS3mg057_0618 [Herpetosiphonaceae bacterium]|nr:MAG: hypothetical protein KatS3mg057_0618 [Herpetosiphonaceae bacterium]
MITATMSVAEVLARYPQTLDVFTGHHSAFNRLRNPMLRRTFARLVTVQQAAAIAGVDAEALLAALNTAIKSEAPGTLHPPAPTIARPRQPDPEPDWLQIAGVEVSLDVREQNTPLASIMRAVREVKPGEIFMLRNTFEPLPLYELLGGRGFAHWARQLGDQDWQIFFYRLSEGLPDLNPTEEALADAPLVLDHRGLDPPQPMIRTLKALKGVKPGGMLVIFTDRQPIFLYEALAEQGYRYETETAEGGGYRTTIRRAD